MCPFGTANAPKAPPVLNVGSDGFLVTPVTAASPLEKVLESPLRAGISNAETGNTRANRSSRLGYCGHNHIPPLLPSGGAAMRPPHLDWMRQGVLSRLPHTIATGSARYPFTRASFMHLCSRWLMMSPPSARMFRL